MIDEKRLQASIDRSEIIHLVSKSIITRDSGLWDKLAECYHSEAEFTSSWWHGKAKDFMKAASERLAEARKEGGEQKHMTSNHLIEINGERATAECDLALFSRRPINGVDLDFITWSRRLHLMVKENGDWKIWRRFAIYERARMDSVDPTVDPNTYFDAKAMEKFPKPMRIHLWRLEVKSSGHTEKICIRGTDQEKVVRGEAQKWIEGA
jgi:SnoaL-like protein